MTKRTTYYSNRPNTINADDFAPQYNEHVKRYWAWCRSEWSRKATETLLNELRK